MIFGEMQLSKSAITKLETSQELVECAGEDELLPAVRELFKAQQYAADAGDDIWNFAVEIARLEKLGFSSTDLRWLVCKGYAEHRCEITRPEDVARQFRRTANLSFAKRTCFVLTAIGTSLAKSMLKGHRVLPGQLSEDFVAAQPARPTPTFPKWDAARHELRLNDMLVKQYKWGAVNQETILAAFEEESWPARIDDPLRPQAEQDPKRRLSDTIKCLNRKQTHQLIHFRGDGTGEGVIWDLVSPHG